MCYNCFVQIKQGVKIMEIKKVLQKLNNQYFKSLKHFKKIYKNYGSLFKKRLKIFNTHFLEIISAIINNKTDTLNLYSNWVFLYLDDNERDELMALIDSTRTNHY